jgi:hypothetical protein
MTHPEGRTPGRQTLLCGGTAFRRDTHATRFAQNPGTNIPGINRINPGGSQAGPRTCHSRTGPGGHSEGQNTRSHPELGRENPQRQWYCVSRRGRVGRRQARPISLPPTAGWSSPVARQAHNLKVRGSNPLPATTYFQIVTHHNGAAQLPRFCLSGSIWGSRASPRKLRSHGAVHGVDCVNRPDDARTIVLASTGIRKSPEPTHAQQPRLPCRPDQVD